MRNNKILLIIIIISLHLTACRSYRFVDRVDTPNNPVFTKKGESELNATINLGNRYLDQPQRNNALNFSAGYAITNQFSVIGSYSYQNEYDYYENVNSDFGIGGFDNYFRNSNVNYKRERVELGLGFNIPIEKTAKYFYSIYAGFSKGHTFFEEHGFDRFGAGYYNRYFRANYSNYFFQNALSAVSKKTTVSLIGKFYFQNFDHVRNNYTTDEKDFFHFTDINAERYFFFQPSIQIKQRCNNFNMMVSMNALWGLSNNTYSYRATDFTFGVSTDIVALMKKHKSKK